MRSMEASVPALSPSGCDGAPDQTVALPVLLLASGVLGSLVPVLSVHVPVLVLSSFVAHVLPHQMSPLPKMSRCPDSRLY